MLEKFWMWLTNAKDVETENQITIHIVLGQSVIRHTVKEKYIQLLLDLEKQFYTHSDRVDDMKQLEFMNIHNESVSITFKLSTVTLIQISSVEG